MLRVLHTSRLCRVDVSYTRSFESIFEKLVNGIRRLKTDENLQRFDTTWARHSPTLNSDFGLAMDGFAATRIHDVGIAG